MRKWFFAFAALCAFVCAFAVPASAQTATNRAGLTTLINNGIYGCTNACITPTILNNILQTMDASASILTDTNAHTGSNTFGGATTFNGSVAFNGSVTGVSVNLVGGSSAITGTCTSGYLLFNNSGTLGCEASGSGYATLSGTNAFTGSNSFSAAPTGIAGPSTTTGDLAILSNTTGTLIDAASAPAIFWNSNQNLEVTGFQYTDNVAAATLAPEQQFGAFVIQDDVFSGATGNHASIVGFVDVQQTPTTTGPYNFVGVWGFSFCNANLGGTGSAGSGECFGVNPQAQVTASATYWNEVAGVETDVEADSGSAVYSKIGENVTTIGSDAVQGSFIDAAILIGSVTGSPGWQNGLALSNFNGNFPISSSGSVINAVTAGTVAYGINFTNLTCSTDCWKSPGATIDGSGNTSVKTATANQYAANGTSPTLTTGTCSGSSAAGGSTAGTFSAATCSASGTYILSALPTAPHGYACDAEDRTTTTDTFVQTATSTTSATLKAVAGTASADVIQFKCLAY